jgi:hypothetical protein
MPKDYDTDWNVHVHVENKNKGISIMERSAGKDNERSKKLELPEEVHDGKVHFDDIYETPYVNLKIGVAACEDDSMCPALDLSDSSNLQNAEGDVNMIEEAGRELDTGVEPMVYSVCQNELERTSQECSAKKDKEKSCGFDVLETVSYAMLVKKVEEETAVKAPSHQSSIQNELKNYSTTGNKDNESSRVALLGTSPVNIIFDKWMVDAHGRAEQLYSTFKGNSSLHVEEASADALLLSAYEVSLKQKTKACYASQPMNPRMGQTGVFGFWMEEGCWICFIQDANGRQWERSCRDLQIHHVQPD